MNEIPSKIGGLSDTHGSHSWSYLMGGLTHDNDKGHIEVGIHSKPSLAQLWPAKDTWWTTLLNQSNNHCINGIHLKTFSTSA